MSRQVSAALSQAPERPERPGSPDHGRAETGRLDGCLPADVEAALRAGNHRRRTARRQSAADPAGAREPDLRLAGNGEPRIAGPRGRRVYHPRPATDRDQQEIAGKVVGAPNGASLYRTGLRTAKILVVPAQAGTQRL